MASPIFAGLSKRLDFYKKNLGFVFLVFRCILKRHSFDYLCLSILACRINPFKLIGVGLTVWTIAALGCGFSYNFWMIAVFRM